MQQKITCNPFVIPPFNDYDRTYHFADGTVMPEFEYWTWRKKLEYEQEKNRSQANLEFMLKCIDSAEVMNDMLKGYAPSIALSRAAKRKQ